MLFSCEDIWFGVHKFEFNDGCLSLRNVSDSEIYQFTIEVISENCRKKTDYSSNARVNNYYGSSQELQTLNPGQVYSFGYPETYRYGDEYQITKIWMYKSDQYYEFKGNQKEFIIWTEDKEGNIESKIRYRVVGKVNKSPNKE